MDAGTESVFVVLLLISFFSLIVTNLYQTIYTFFGWGPTWLSNRPFENLNFTNNYAVVKLLYETLYIQTFSLYIKEVIYNQNSETNIFYACLLNNSIWKEFHLAYSLKYTQPTIKLKKHQHLVGKVENWAKSEENFLTSCLLTNKESIIIT